ncbi:MAG: hypothetical protein KGY49_04605, partial [Wenzhouxiangellaceae bacterium]|nr:hypothetical protein [Wenzhouxiangellaceae bacterium]
MIHWKECRQAAGHDSTAGRKRRTRTARTNPLIADRPGIPELSLSFVLHNTVTNENITNEN